MWSGSNAPALAGRPRRGWKGWRIRLQGNILDSNLPPDTICGFILECRERHARYKCKLLQIPVTMPQPISPRFPGSGNVTDEPQRVEPPAEQNPPAELPAERSKFSRWLASFGLGETPIPLLRPAKPPQRPGER